MVISPELRPELSQEGASEGERKLSNYSPSDPDSRAAGHTSPVGACACAAAAAGRWGEGGERQDTRRSYPSARGSTHPRASLSREQPPSLVRPQSRASLLVPSSPSTSYRTRRERASDGVSAHGARRPSARCTRVRAPRPTVRPSDTRINRDTADVHRLTASGRPCSQQEQRNRALLRARAPASAAAAERARQSARAFIERRNVSQSQRMQATRTPF